MGTAGTVARGAGGFGRDDAPAEELAFTRADFPALEQEVNGEPLIYFDNGATTQKPHSVITAISSFYERDNANVHRGLHELSNRSTEAFEAARERVGEFIGAPSTEEVIYTRGTTEGLNLVASCWGGANVKEGDTILLTEMEHHSNIVPWQMLAERTGAKLDYVAVGEDGRLDLSHLDAKLDAAKVFAFTHISNTLGTVNPVAELCSRARAAEVVTVVDAAQSVGHLEINVAEMGADFVAFSAHKMAGPTGIGILWGRAELLDGMPPYQGGGEMISTVTYEKSTWNALPHKFEAGTPNIAGPIGLHAACDYLDRIGRDRIWAHDCSMGAYAETQLREIPGLRILGPDAGRAGLCAFTIEGLHAHDIITLADNKGIALRGGHHCTMPLHAKLGIEASARASFYLYNTHAEIDRLVEVLRGILRFLEA